MKLGEALFVTAFMAGTTSLLAQTYTVTDLGAVSGQTQSIGSGLNATGQAAGASSSPNGDIPTLFSGGKAINIGTLLAGDVSLATGINDSGAVAGYEPEEFGDGFDHAWVLSGGRLMDIHSPSLFPQGTQAFAINDAGVVVGQGNLNLNNANFHAFVYANGKMTDIGPPGAYQASATAINNNGQVLGNAYIPSGGGGTFIYANGKITFLTAPAGATAASGFALNSLGEVAGTLYFNGGGTHLAVYSGGKWNELSTVTNNTPVRVDGINASELVIATQILPQTYHPFRAGKHVPYIVNGNGLVNLNTLIPANSGYTITDPVAINDAGQILCDASTPTSPKHAVLLSPK